LDEIRELYDEERTDYLAGMKEKVYEPLEKARAQKFVIDFKEQDPPPVPKAEIGKPIVLKDYQLQKLVPAIDWNPFFQVWRLRGQYPNRNYPKVFNDPTVGEQARKVFDEATQLIKEIIDKKLLKATAVFAFYPCNSKGDDILIYENDERKKVIGTLYGLRQQEQKVDEKPIFHALGDFIAPVGSGIKDYIGLFAVSAGFGSEELCAKFEKEHDDYNSIMVKAIADRFAEAFAEVLHSEVRKQYWGYVPEENFSAADLHKIKYRGIRPAPGYPMQPDHDEKRTLWKLMKVEELAGIKLTESLAMWPGASVCGLYMANPEAKYFSLGKITKEQVHDYATRKGKTEEEIEKLMPNVLTD